MATGDLTVRVLGPVQLVGPGGETVDVPSASQRRLLAALALHAPGPVRSSWLCDLADVSPGALRTLVARLRRVVGADLLQTAVGGYRLAATVDAAVACAEIAGADGEPSVLSRALDRWVGPALAEFEDEAWAVGDAARLATVRAGAVEDLAEAQIARRQVDQALARLVPHVVDHPLRDRPRGLTIRALAAAGRQTEALRHYQEYRDLLAETAGTEPSEELRSIEQRVAGGWDGITPDGAAGRNATPPSPRPASPVLDAALTATPTSVGRHDELARLAAATDRVVEWGVGAALVAGEVGIGKTTLIGSFARGHCTEHGWAVRYGRCDEDVSVPFQPFPHLIGQMVDDLSADELMAHTATCGGDLLRLLPRLHTRISAPPAMGSDENTARHLLFDAVLDIVRRAAAQGPQVVVVDDLQWAEPAALHLLRHLVRNLADAPVLLLMSLRTDGEPVDDHLRRALAELARADATRIDLEGLDPTDLADLVQARGAAGADPGVGAIADHLQAETAGHPLYADHLLRHWVEAGRIHPGGMGATVSTPIPIDLPPTLRDLVWHRVSLLGDGADVVLTAAAVLGLQFNERVLDALPEVEGLDVARLLDRAVAAGVLADHPSLSGTVRFTHALVARALEAELGTRARTQLHAHAFAALLADRGGTTPEQAPRLAHHAAAGDLLAEAQHWAAEAGDQALAHLALDEAARWFRTALDHAVALDRPDAERADLLVRLGEARARAGLPGSLDAIREGAELAERAGADAVLVRAALAADRGTIRIGSFAEEQLEIVEAALRAEPDIDLGTRARLTAQLAQSLMPTDQTERRTAAALDAVELARSSSDPVLLARVAPDVLHALWAPGWGPTRSALASEATAIADEVDDPHLTFVVHYAAYCSAVCAGNAEDADRHLGRVRAVAEEVGEPQMRWVTGILDGFVATMEARFDEAEAILARTLELAQEVGEPDVWSMFLGQSFVLGTFAGRHAELLPFVEQGLDAERSLELSFRIAHAIVCCEVGQLEVPSALLDEARDVGLEAIPRDFLRSTVLLGYAVLALELDDVAAAGWLYPEIAPMAGEVSFNGATGHGPISAYAGKLASVLGRYADAEELLRTALALCEDFGWEYHRASTLVALAQNQLRADGALDEDGEVWLATAEELCAAHGIGIWGDRAAALRVAATA